MIYTYYKYVIHQIQNDSVNNPIKVTEGYLDLATLKKGIKALTRANLRIVYTVVHTNLPIPTEDLAEFNG